MDCETSSQLIRGSNSFEGYLMEVVVTVRVGVVPGVGTRTRPSRALSGDRVKFCPSQHLPPRLLHSNLESQSFISQLQCSNDGLSKTLSPTMGIPANSGNVIFLNDSNQRLTDQRT